MQDSWCPGTEAVANGIKVLLSIGCFRAPSELLPLVCAVIFLFMEWLSLLLNQDAGLSKMGRRREPFIPAAVEKQRIRAAAAQRNTEERAEIAVMKRSGVERVLRPHPDLITGLFGGQRGGGVQSG